MHPQPTIVVRKGGFFSALATGLFIFLTAGVVCASGVSIYALSLFDRRAGEFLGAGERMLASLPEWQKALPPAVSEALRDAREPNYREMLDVRATLARTGRHDDRAVVEVTNKGDRTISLLSVRVTLEDAEGVPLDTASSYVATPLAIDGPDWHGPILPGATRRVLVRGVGARNAARAAVEVNELRVWLDEPAVSPPAAVRAEP